MENRMNQVMTLGNGEKYLILRQAIYEDEKYYVCVKTTDDAKEVTDSYELLHEFLNDCVKVVEAVTDWDLAQTIFEYVGLMED